MLCFHGSKQRGNVFKNENVCDLRPTKNAANCDNTLIWAMIPFNCIKFLPTLKILKSAYNFE
jgi:hypothetical protein